MSKQRRVVITGLGIISCIGNNTDEVLSSLQGGKSGITFSPQYAEMGFRSHVYGKPQIEPAELIDKRIYRFMGEGAAYNHLAMEQAIADAGLEQSDVSNERTGIIMGSGGPSTSAQIAAADIAREKSPKRVGPFAVPKCMSSTNSATIATNFKIKGVNYSISSACSTSGHCIGNASELIQWGKQDVMLAGGGEELDWALSVLFDAMGALSSKYNDTPEKASRAYDANRDGFVIAGGGGVVVLEELEHAKARGAKIYAEITGYGMSGDAYHVTSPPEDGNGGYRSMCMALKRSGLNVSDIGYVNAHGTSTPIGDGIEVRAVKTLFGSDIDGVSMSSTKSAIGHLLGAAGAAEAIYSIKALETGILPPTLNLENVSEDCKDIDLVPKVAKEKKVKAALSNSFGFGGTNASLLFQSFES